MKRALYALFLVSATSCAAGVEEPPTGAATSGSTATGSGSSTSVTTTSSSSGVGGMGGGTSSSSASSTSSSSSAASSSSASSGGAGGCAPWSHTIALDGVDDFAGLEKPPTSSIDYTARVTWDDTYLYVGMQGPDVASNSSTRWLLVYLSGAGGTTGGVPYNTQMPTLPFGAKWHVRWRADNGFTQAMSWSGTQWVDAGWDFTGDVFQNGNFIEMRFPRADFGSPATVDVHLSMINEAGGGEFTFAGLPKASFLDSVDPDYTKFFAYDFDGCAAPSTYLPQ